MKVFIQSNFWNHPKLQRFAAILGIKPVEAGGYLIKLWCWVMDYRENGSLRGLTENEISSAAGWDKDGKSFFKAMLSCRWIDARPLQVHDWLEHQGSMIRERASARSRMKARRETERAPNVRRTCAERSEVPYHTVPIRTVPNQSKPVPSPKDDNPIPPLNLETSPSPPRQAKALPLELYESEDTRRKVEEYEGYLQNKHDVPAARVDQILREIWNIRERLNMETLSAGQADRIFRHALEESMKHDAGSSAYIARVIQTDVMKVRDGIKI